MSHSTLPAGWDTVRFGEVAENYISGGTPTTKDAALWDGDVAWTTSAPIAETDVSLRSAQRCISSRALKSSATNLVPKGNLLVGTRVGVGKAVVNFIDIAISQDLTGVVLDHQRVNAEFLAYYFKQAAVQNFINGRKRGTTIQGISRFDLDSIPLLLPPLPEQRAIASTLRAVQDAKDARRHELELERERKAALMQHLFTYSTRGEPLKDTEIGTMPQSWQVVRLNNHVTLITKGSSPKWQGFEYRDEGIVFVRSQNVGWGRLELSEVAYLPEGFNKKEKKSIIRTNDLLINIVGASIGRAALANESVSGGNLNQAVALARLKHEYEPAFVMHFLFTTVGQLQLQMQKKDIARANLSLQDIANISIPLTSIEEQVEVAGTLRACDDKIAALEHESKYLDELFRALLEELMSGRLSAIPLVEASENAP